MRGRAVFAAFVGVLALVSLSFAPHSIHAQARQATPIKLYVLDGGTLESDPARYQLTKEDVGVTQLSIAGWLATMRR